jgi:hypothetical protein
MKISKKNKEVIIKEMEYAISKMRSESEEKNKLYYFSATYGVLQRVFNIEYDDDLLFIHFVLNSTYNGINVRLQNPDPVIKIPENFFSRLEDITEELVEALKSNLSIYEHLKKIVLLGYVTIGNGYYLYQKGLLKI